MDYPAFFPEGAFYLGVACISGKAKEFPSVPVPWESLGPCGSKQLQRTTGIGEAHAEEVLLGVGQDGIIRARAGIGVASQDRLGLASPRAGKVPREAAKVQPFLVRGGVKEAPKAGNFPCDAFEELPPCRKVGREQAGPAQREGGSGGQPIQRFGGPTFSGRPEIRADCPVCPGRIHHHSKEESGGHAKPAANKARKEAYEPPGKGSDVNILPQRPALP